MWFYLLCDVILVRRCRTLIQMRFDVDIGGIELRKAKSSQVGG
jgi:hypothetical protein